MYVNVPWTDTTYSLPTATSTSLGGVKIGYTESGKNYPVELSSDQMYVNVPWTDTIVSVDSTITDGGTNPVESNAIHDALANKQNSLSSTSNLAIKRINLDDGNRTYEQDHPTNRPFYSSATTSTTPQLECRTVEASYGIGLGASTSGGSVQAVGLINNCPLTIESKGDANLVFKTNSNDVMRISGSGPVNADYGLEAFNRSSTTSIIRARSSNMDAPGNHWVDMTYYALSMDDNGQNNVDFEINQKTNRAMIFKTNNAEAMRILNNGDLKINIGKDIILGGAVGTTNTAGIYWHTGNLRVIKVMSLNSEAEFSFHKSKKLKKK